jgi:hypothetical protein
MTVLTEPRNRGLSDVLICCCDGLKGLPEAIADVWPQATVQECVVHLVRSSLRLPRGALGLDHQSPAHDLHRPDNRGGRGPV